MIVVERTGRLKKGYWSDHSILKYTTGCTCHCRKLARMQKIRNITKDLISEVSTYTMNPLHFITYSYYNHKQQAQYQSTLVEDQQNNIIDIQRCVVYWIIVYYCDSDLCVSTFIIIFFREELKRQKIAAALQDYLTSHYIIRPRMGSTVYFEYPFTNSHTHPLNVSVSWKDPDLKWAVLH